MKNKFYPISIITIFIFVSCMIYSFGQGEEMKLLKEGYIEVGGGCIEYTTGKIVFRPRGENVEVEIDNKGYYFRDRDGQTLLSFKGSFSAKELEPFFVKLNKLLNAPQPSWIPVSTASAKVKIVLPFTSQPLDRKIEEEEGKFAVEPLLTLIRAFVYGLNQGKLELNISDEIPYPYYFNGLVKFTKNEVIKSRLFTLQFIGERQEKNGSIFYDFIIKNDEIKDCIEQKTISWRRPSATIKNVPVPFEIAGEMFELVILPAEDKPDADELILYRLGEAKKNPKTEYAIQLLKKIIQAKSPEAVQEIFHQGFKVKDSTLKDKDKEWNYRTYIKDKEGDPIFYEITILTYPPDKERMSVSLILKNDIQVNYDRILEDFGKYKHHPYVYVNEGKEYGTPSELFIIDSNTKIIFYYYPEDKNKKISTIVISYNTPLPE